MIRKILAVLAVTAAVFIALPGQANALTSSLPACTENSGFGYDVKVCAVWGWRMQNDGSGVHVENVNVYAAKGCGDLESKAFESLYALSFATGEHRSIGDQYSCNVTWDLEQNGPDVGQGTFSLAGNANVDAASDFDFTLVCTIKPNNPDDCSGSHN